jgi:shikimate kinase
MSGSGKSTIGPALARKLGFSFTDLDLYIQEKDHKTIQELVDTIGEEALLQLEELRMHEINLDHRVVSPGGSIIYHPALMQHLKQHSILVYIDEDFQNIEARVTRSPGRGIVGLKHKSLKQIYDDRKLLYARYADITISPQGRSTEQIIVEIIEHLSQFITR